MNGHTRVFMNDDGSARVSTGNSVWDWTKEDVIRAREVSHSCCESRRVYYPQGATHCPCLACEVTSALITWMKHNGFDSKIFSYAEQGKDLE